MHLKQYFPLLLILFVSLSLYAQDDFSKQLKYQLNRYILSKFVKLRQFVVRIFSLFNPNAGVNS